MPKGRPRAKVDAKGRNPTNRFVKLEHYLLDSPAWKHLGLGARALLPALLRRFNGSNNGEISLSVREAAEDLKVSPDTASKYLHQLEAFGFIVPTLRGSFHWKAAQATMWQLTMLPVSDDRATKDFMRWRPPEGSKSEKQNTVLKIRTDGPKKPDRGRAETVENGTHGPKNLDRKPSKQPSHGPKNLDTSSIPRGNSPEDLLDIPAFLDRRARS